MAFVSYPLKLNVVFTDARCFKGTQRSDSLIPQAFHGLLSQLLGQGVLAILTGCVQGCETQLRRADQTDAQNGRGDQGFNQGHALLCRVL